MFFYDSEMKNKCQEKNLETTIKKSLAKKYLNNLQVQKKSFLTWIFASHQDDKMCRSLKI